MPKEVFDLPFYDGQGVRVKLRQAGLADLDALCAVEKESFDPLHYPLTTRRQFRYLLSKGNCEIWVAVRQDKICGMVVLFFRKNTYVGRLYSIVVHPDFQGGLIGKALFEASEAVIKAKGLKGMVLEIRGDNARHLVRYQKLGYVAVDILPDYYPDGMAAIKLRKLF